MKIFHEKQKNHNCHLCIKKFGYRGDLNQHIKRVHEGGVKNHKCDTCGKNFFKSGDRNKHMIYVHEGQKDFKCDSCGKTYPTQSHLRKHNDAVQFNILITI